MGLGGLKADGTASTGLNPAPRRPDGRSSCAGPPTGAVTDLTPAPFNVRTRAHEYGGGAFGVGNGVVVFANFADQRVYRLEAGADPRPITPSGPSDTPTSTWTRRGGGRSACARTIAVARNP